MEIECIGFLSEKGKISIDSSLFEKFQLGTQVKIKIEVPDRDTQGKKRREISDEAKKFIEMMENAQPIGAPDDPQELSHSKLAEERMEEKFPWSE